MGPSSLFGARTPRRVRGRGHRDVRPRTKGPPSLERPGGSNVASRSGVREAGAHRIHRCLYSRASCGVSRSSHCGPRTTGTEDFQLSIRCAERKPPTPKALGVGGEWSPLFPPVPTPAASGEAGKPWLLVLVEPADHGEDHQGGDPQDQQGDRGQRGRAPPGLGPGGSLSRIRWFLRGRGTRHLAGILLQEAGWRSSWSFERVRHSPPPWPS